MKGTETLYVCGQKHQYKKPKKNIYVMFQASLPPDLFGNGAVKGLTIDTEK